MGDIITFLGLRRGVGNATLARAFTVEAAWSMDCLLLEVDRSDDTSSDWSKRRAGRDHGPEFTVEPVSSVDLLHRSFDVDLAIVQASGAAEESAVSLARKSTLLVVTTTSRPEDISAVERPFKVLSGHGLTGKSVVALCRIDSNEESRAARELLSRQGIRVIDGDIGESKSLGELQMSGRAISEGLRPHHEERVDGVIKAIQAAFLGE